MWLAVGEGHLGLCVSFLSDRGGAVQGHNLRWAFYPGCLSEHGSRCPRCPPGRSPAAWLVGCPADPSEMGLHPLLLQSLLSQGACYCESEQILRHDESQNKG